MPEKKVLLVDDELDLLEIMKTKIRSWGYEVTAISESGKVIKAMDDTKPDVMILDYLMPDIDGITLLKKIRAIDKKIPVIMFTAHPEHKALEDSKKLNIAAFIPKLSPYGDTMENVKAALDMAVKGRTGKNVR